jgi:hypothetical protein
MYIEMIILNGYVRLKMGVNVHRSPLEEEEDRAPPLIINDDDKMYTCIYIIRS